MLFWLFVIIGAVALVGAFVIIALAPSEDELKDAREVALCRWDMSLKLNAHPKEINEKRDAYYAADEALDEYRKSNRTKEKVCNGFAIALFVIAVVAVAVVVIVVKKKNDKK